MEYKIITTFNGVELPKPNINDFRVGQYVIVPYKEYMYKIEWESFDCDDINLNGLEEAEKIEFINIFGEIRYDSYHDVNPTHQVVFPILKTFEELSNMALSGDLPEDIFGVLKNVKNITFDEVGFSYTYYSLEHTGNDFSFFSSENIRTRYPYTKKQLLYLRDINACTSNFNFCNEVMSAIKSSVK